MLLFRHCVLVSCMCRHTNGLSDGHFAERDVHRNPISVFDSICEPVIVDVRQRISEREPIRFRNELE